VESLSNKADERVEGIDFDQEYLHARLRDGRTISVPLSWYPRLLHATPEQRRNYELVRDGYEMHWPDVDEDLTAEAFLRGWPAVPGSIPEEMRRITFAPGQEPRVKIGVSEECRRGDCEQCPGMLGDGILCVCGHHLKSNQDS
jgi:hypothetical protein